MSAIIHTELHFHSRQEIQLQINKEKVRELPLDMWITKPFRLHKMVQVKSILHKFYLQPLILLSKKSESKVQKYQVHDDVEYYNRLNLGHMLATGFSLKYCIRI